MPKISNNDLIAWLNKYPIAMEAFKDDKGDDPEDYLTDYGHIEDLADRVYSDLLNHAGIKSLPAPNANEPTQEELIKLWKLTTKFVTDQRISCSETVYQVDRVIENAYEFIDAASCIVGFYKDEDD